VSLEERLYLEYVKTPEGRRRLAEISEDDPETPPRSSP
jgi:hypothetical protein